MQTIPPVSVLALPLVERPQADLAIRGPSETSAGAQQGGTGNSDARDPMLASERAREVARLIGAAGDDEFIIPGFPPLDTREVGDQDIIDPNRPAVRGPEPLSEIEDTEGLPPLPDEVDPVTGETTDEIEPANIPGMPGGAETDQEGNTAPEAKKAEDALPGQKVTAKPASPGASAPDVPEPPEPGAVDIRR